MVKIKKADESELQKLLTIYLEKVKWLKDTGKGMWDESEFTLDSLKKHYADPDYFIGSADDGTIIGGFILVSRDHLYWPEKDDDAFYFHKFIIKNGCGGKGYSDEMIDWVLTYSKINNKKYVRLDYDGDRSYIKALYTRHGFIPVGTVPNKQGINLIKAEYLVK